MYIMSDEQYRRMLAAEEKRVEAGALLRDCSSYAFAMGQFEGSGEGSALSRRVDAFLRDWALPK